MLTLKNISVEKEGNIILKKISVDIHQGDKVLFKGESGSGKSTLLKSILFFEDFTGEILFNKEDISSNNLCEYRNKFSYIGQTPISYDKSVKDFILLPFSFKNNINKKLNEDNLNKYLKSFMFSNDILNQNYNTLSGGEKQRISLIQTLLLDKKIIVLDEVTSALDPVNKQNVISELSKIEDLTLLIVSHDPEWETHSTKIVELSK